MYSAGNYTASAWRAIDYIIARAGQYGIKLIYVVADNWQQADSVINVSFGLPAPVCFHMSAGHACLCSALLASATLPKQGLNARTAMQHHRCMPK